MTTSLNEFKKAMAELIAINEEQWINLPTYLRQKLLQNMQKMLIAIKDIKCNQ